MRENETIICLDGLKYLILMIFNLFLDFFLELIDHFKCPNNAIFACIAKIAELEIVSHFKWSKHPILPIKYLTRKEEEKSYFW